MRMQNILSLKSYREVIKAGLDRLKRTGYKGGFSQLSDATGIHRPYLSRVMGGHADLNADQAHAVCEFLGFDEGETEYTQLLLDYARATHPARKARLKTKIRSIRERELEIKTQLRAPEAAVGSVLRYYLNPIYQIVHMYLTIPRFQSNPRLIAAQLNISPKQLEDTLSVLVAEGLVTQVKPGQFVSAKDAVHLPDDSPLCLSQQILVRARSLERLSTLGPKNSFRFSVTFSADEETYDGIRERFNRFLRELEPMVRAAPCENVYQLNFDLFPY